MLHRYIGLALGLLLIVAQVCASPSNLRSTRHNIHSEGSAGLIPSDWIPKKAPKDNNMYVKRVGKPLGTNMKRNPNGISHDKDRKPETEPYSWETRTAKDVRDHHEKRAAAPVTAYVSASKTVNQPEEAHRLTERAPISSVAPNITDKAWINGVLSRVDLWREQFGAAPLVWSTTLATYALTQANKCLLQHSGGPYGENIYWISSRSVDFYSQMKKGVDAWGDEYKLYNASNPHNEPALHFTALVWKNARSVGCAWTSSTCQNARSGFYLFCEFNPVTNVMGQFEQNVQPTKSLEQ